MAKPPKKKAPSGTLIDRLNEARNRPYKGTKGGVPERVGRYSKGKLNTARTPDSIRMGQGSKSSVTAKKTVPLGDKPKLLSGPKAPSKPSIAGTLIRGAYKAVGGPAVMLVSMTVPAGEGSDKPSGPLFSPSKNRAAGKGNPKTVNPYRKSSTSSMAGGSKMANSTQSGAMRSKISMAGGGVNKPEVKNTASDFKKKNLAANQKVGKDVASAQPPKVAAPKQPKGMTFQEAVRRNRSDEYTRAKMKPKGSLLGLLRKRKSMG